MADCYRECYRIVSKWESYTIDTHGKYGAAGCPDLSDQEIEEHVAAAVRNHNANESVEESGCPGGCLCARYEKPRPSLPPIRRIEQRRIGWETRDKCIYIVSFTVSVLETVTPIGFCRPDRTGRQTMEPLPHPEPQPQTLPGDIAPTGH